MLTVVGCVILLLTCLIASANADSELTRRSLKGLPGVQVLIESLEPEVERDGLVTSTVQTDVELRLRQSGIRVLSDAESLTASSPTLYVFTNALRRSDGTYVYSIRVELDQNVLLARNPKTSLFAPTWNATQAVGSVGVARMPTAVRESIRDQIDQFINAYLAVNPK